MEWSDRADGGTGPSKQIRFGEKTEYIHNTCVGGSGTRIFVCALCDFCLRPGSKWLVVLLVVAQT